MTDKTTPWFLRRFFDWMNRPTVLRLRRLEQSGRTVEVDALPADSPIIVINLGHGDEYWVMSGDAFSIERQDRTIEGGRLITRGGAPLRDPTPLRTRGLSWDMMSVRFH